MLEGIPAIAAMLGLLALFCLPFVVLYWIVKRLFFGMRRKADYIQRLIPDGQPITGRVTHVIGGNSTMSTRRIARFEYIDSTGRLHRGETGSVSYRIGDTIELMYLPSDPQVHEEAAVILAFRKKLKT
ncbi:MAG: DUF3592 domain-containing protein [Pseudomonadota bacterium]